MKVYNASGVLLTSDPDAAPLDSPDFTGIPTADTAADGTDTCQLATTEFVQNALVDTALTGNPTAPTPADNDNDTSIATSAFVQGSKNLPHPTLIPLTVASKGGIYNGDFETAPPFTAAQTSNGYIVGTAAGSATDDRYGWYAYAPSAAISVQFDTGVTHNGLVSLKVSMTNTTGRCVVDQPYQRHWMKLQPSTKYRLSVWVKTNNVATDAIYCTLLQYTSTFGAIGFIYTPKLSGTNDWTLLSVEFTSDATAYCGRVQMYNYVAGNVSDAWFDDLIIEEVVEDTGYTGTSPTPLLTTITGKSDYVDIYDNYKLGGDTDATYSTTYWRSQQFIPIRPKMATASVVLKKVGSPTGNLTFTVEIDNGSNLPNGVPIAATTLDVSTLTTSYLEYTINLPCNLTVGAKYFVTFKRPSADGVTNYVVIRYKTTGAPFTDYTANGAGSWVANNGIQYDLKTNFVKHTENPTIICNGEKLSLQSSEEGVFNNAVIDLDKGKYLWQNVPTTGIPLEAINVYEASQGGRTDSVLAVNGWYMTMLASDTNEYLATNDAVIRYLTFKVDTLLPIKHLKFKFLLYSNSASAEKLIQISTDNTTWTTMKTLVGVGLGRTFFTCESDVANGYSVFFIRFYKQQSPIILLVV
ncbi:MAG: carbohydrate binding domain-containing protein [Candidatus Babeliales bacterium]|jgi:hypothetical protein